jgi:hypothetical protein
MDPVKTTAQALAIGGAGPSLFQELLAVLHLPEAKPDGLQKHVIRRALIPHGVIDDRVPLFAGELDFPGGGERPAASFQAQPSDVCHRGRITLLPAMTPACVVQS